MAMARDTMTEKPPGAAAKKEVGQSHCASLLMISVTSSDVEKTTRVEIMNGSSSWPEVISFTV